MKKFLILLLVLLAVGTVAGEGTILNCTFSLDIIEAKTGSRPNTLGVVSSEYHLFRTGLQARELKLDIIGIPAKTGSFDRWLHYFVREIAGVWHYLLLGGQNR